MGMKLQIRERISELLYTDRYYTDDVQTLVEQRIGKQKMPLANQIMKNPVFSKICKLMDVNINFDRLRDYYFSIVPGNGTAIIFQYKDTEYFFVLNLYRGRLDEDDSITMAIYCDSNKFIILKPLFEVLQKNSDQAVKPSITCAPLIKSVIEASNGCIYYKGKKIVIANEKIKRFVCNRR